MRPPRYSHPRLLSSLLCLSSSASRTLQEGSQDNDAKAKADREAEERATRIAADAKLKSGKKKEKAAALEKVGAELRKLRQRRDDLKREQEQLQAEMRMAEGTIRQCRSELNDATVAVTQAENTVVSRHEEVAALDKRLMAIMSDQGSLEDSVRAELAEEQSKAVVAAIGASVNKYVGIDRAKRGRGERNSVWRLDARQWDDVVRARKGGSGVVSVFRIAQLYSRAPLLSSLFPLFSFLFPLSSAGRRQKSSRASWRCRSGRFPRTGGRPSPCWASERYAPGQWAGRHENGRRGMRDRRLLRRKKKGEKQSEKPRTRL